MRRAAACHQHQPCPGLCVPQGPGAGGQCGGGRTVRGAHREDGGCAAGPGGPRAPQPSLHSRRSSGLRRPTPQGPGRAAGLRTQLRLSAPAPGPRPPAPCGLKRPVLSCSNHAVRRRRPCWPGHSSTPWATLHLSATTPDGVAGKPLREQARFRCSPFQGSPLLEPPHPSPYVLTAAETKGGVPRGASPPTGAEWPAPSSRPGARRPTPTWRLQTPPRGPSAAAQAQLRRLPPRPNADQSD